MADVQELPSSKEAPGIFDYIAYNKIGEKNFEFDRIVDVTQKPISLPQIEEGTILEVETEVGPAFFKPEEGTLSKRIISKAFKDGGFPTQNPPFFVRRIFPAEKVRLVKEGYRVTTIDEIVTSPVASPA